MVAVLSNISNIIIPVIIFYVVAYGLAARSNVYEDFIKGAKDGFYTVIQIMPTLIGLMVAVGVLRASGFLDALSGWLSAPAAWLHLPPQLIPMTLVRLVSNSAATGLALDIFARYGPDSFLGMAASVMMSSTETVFYCISIYFGSVRVTKIRYVLPGALLATAAGVAASIYMAFFTN